MEKFKVGDRVIVVSDEHRFNNSKFESPVGKIRTIIGLSNSPKAQYRWYVKSDIDCENNWEYDDDGTDIPCTQFHYKDCELIRATLPYTKITEKLMQGKIDKIEDGKIYLK